MAQTLADERQLGGGECNVPTFHPPAHGLEHRQAHRGPTHRVRCLELRTTCALIRGTDLAPQTDLCTVRRRLTERSRAIKAGAEPQASQFSLLPLTDLTVKGKQQILEHPVRRNDCHCAMSAQDITA